MRLQHRVVVGVAPGLRVGVHQRRGQPRQRVQQTALGADRDLMGLDSAGTGVNDHFAFGPQLMADPPQPDLADTRHPGSGRSESSTWSTRAGSTASISRR
jgi:hypothetical protein